ncbi:uncharacterized protein LOC119167300 [Rhipicephalus microplus]|uniref:uncharacterized protein LOC119167300 n=1 Tax=Rhipicephalus microplus TaxID=6941 RepID=UPI003F6B54A1
MMSRRRSVLVMLLGALLIGACQAQIKAGCKLETLRACGDDFVPYGKATHLLSSGEQFQRACTTKKQQIACRIKFVHDCMEGVTKAAALVILDGFKENLDGACDEASKHHQAFEKAVGCMNSVGTKLNSCWRTFRGEVQRAVAKASTKDVIFYTCCSYHELVNCADQSLTPCESSGGKRLSLNLLQAAFGDAVDLLCGEHKKGSQACKALPELPALGANDRKVENYVELLAAAASTIGRKN